MAAALPRHRGWYVWAAFLVQCHPLFGAQENTAVWNGAEVRLAAPGFHFLTGKALERLKNGSAVTFAFQFTALGEGVVLKRTLERFVVSYDLWEEKFSVTQMMGRKSPRRAGSRLSPAGTEAWCLESLPLGTEGLTSDRSITLQLDVIAENKDYSPLLTEPGLSLTALIELFSRPSRPGREQRMQLRVGPLKLSDIKR